jgi:hypothetical protein
MTGNMFFVIKKKRREVVAFADSYMTKEKKLITIHNTGRR